jgi:PKHD-type hydroxylase
VEAVRAALASATFIDGKATAGWAARGVKANLQAERGPELERAAQLVEERLATNPVFALALRPKACSRATSRAMPTGPTSTTR